jgi:hypothetical protein
MVRDAGVLAGLSTHNPAVIEVRGNSDLVRRIMVS